MTVKNNDANNNITTKITIMTVNNIMIMIVNNNITTIMTI